VVTTAPPAKPSAQTQFLLDEMAVEAQKLEDRWERMLESMDQITKRLDEVD
jgi:hypothetical protein